MALKTINILVIFNQMVIELLNTLFIVILKIQ